MKKAMKQSTLITLTNGISILALLFLCFTVLCYGNVNNKVNVANTQRFDLTFNANRFMNGSAYLTNEVRAYAATGDRAHYDNYWNEINTLKNRDIGVAAMKQIGITAAEQKMIDEMSNLSNTLVPLEEQAMKDVETGRMQSAVDYVYGKEYSDSIAKINSLKSQFLDTLDQRASNEVNRLVGVSYFIRFVLFLVMGIIILLQITTVQITRKKIIRPVLVIKQQMEEISRGNLSADFPLTPDTSEIGMLVDSIHTTKRELKLYIGDIQKKLTQMADGNMNLVVDTDYHGEFVPIQEAMRTILNSLNKVLFQISKASEQVASEADQVASTSQSLSQGADEQAATAEQVVVSLKDVLGQVETTTENASIAQSCSVDAAHQLTVGNEKMANLSQAMAKISGASTQIGGIIKTIEDIAFQTNILALNAAVEAARAGVAGKGFAVVADEVRRLAAKSSEAAKDTTALIENTLRLVNEGSTLAVDTTDALNLVVDSAQKSTGLVGEIATSAAQQSIALRELATSMQQISSVVQNNAAMAEESAASAQELSGQADSLKSSVYRFKLRDGSVSYTG